MANPTGWGAFAGGSQEPIDLPEARYECLKRTKATGRSSMSHPPSNRRVRREMQ